MSVCFERGAHIVQADLELTAAKAGLERSSFHLPSAEITGTHHITKPGENYNLSKIFRNLCGPKKGLLKATYKQMTFDL